MVRARTKELVELWHTEVLPARGQKPDPPLNAKEVMVIRSAVEADFEGALDAMRLLAATGRTTPLRFAMRDDRAELARLWRSGSGRPAARASPTPRPHPRARTYEPEEPQLTAILPPPTRKRSDG
jgi:hypothetical protein